MKSAVRRPTTNAHSGSLCTSWSFTCGAARDGPAVGSFIRNGSDTPFCWPAECFGFAGLVCVFRLSACPAQAGTGRLAAVRGAPASRGLSSASRRGCSEVPTRRVRSPSQDEVVSCMRFGQMPRGLPRGSLPSAIFPPPMHVLTNTTRWPGWRTPCGIAARCTGTSPAASRKICLARPRRGARRRLRHRRAAAPSARGAAGVVSCDVIGQVTSPQWRCGRFSACCGRAEPSC